MNYRHSQTYGSAVWTSRLIKMQRPYNERWERTKRYLFRNLLVDPGFRLSPVPEELRSDSSDERPYSPLPELIVEREPNRHDDSQEFYQDLEVRMKRYYRKLFLEGGTEADSVEYEDITDIDVNRSMASTFIIDSNVSKDSKGNRSTSDKSDKQKGGTKNTDDECDDELLTEIHKVPEYAETPFKYETYDMLDMGKDRRISNEENNKTYVETESDSTQDNHRISITGAQIHEEKKRPGIITRIFEDGSPILLPRLHQFSKHIFGDLSADINKVINYTDKEDVVEESWQQIIQGAGTSNIMAKPDKRTEKDTAHNQPEGQKQIETKDKQQNLDLEVKKNMMSSDVATSLIPNVIQTHQVEDKTSCSDVDEEELVLNEQSTTTDDSAETEGIEELGDEESIGPNEYDYTQQHSSETSVSEGDYMVEKDDDSFERALQKGTFERINKIKTFTQSSDDELTRSSKSDSENQKTLEVMRGATQTESLKVSLEPLRRMSTMSHESSVVRDFEQPTREKFEEETSFFYKGQAMSSDESKDTQGDRGSLQNSNSSPSQISVNDLDLSEGIKSQSKKSLKNKESGIGLQDVTPTIPVNDLVTTLCHDIWSVSPIDIDLSPTVQSSAALSRREYAKKDKREAGAEADLEASEKKKKKYQNVEVQTGAREESYQGWEEIKTDFFVGTPLVFNLCSCQNHICP